MFLHMGDTSAQNIVHMLESIFQSYTFFIQLLKKIMIFVGPLLQDGSLYNQILQTLVQIYHFCDNILYKMMCLKRH